MKRDKEARSAVTGRRNGETKDQGGFLNFEERPGSLMVLATVTSVIVAALIGVGILSPLLFTAAVFPFFYRALRHSDHRSGVALVFRWGIALFASLLVVGIFVPDRLGAALPLSDGAVRNVETWIREPQTAPPADTRYLLWGMLAFLVASVVSGGLLGFIIGAVGVGAAAYAAIFLFRHGLNIFQIGFVAIPVWQLSLFVAGAFLLVPSSVFVFERFFERRTRPEDWEHLRKYMYMGAGFFALSIALRYVTAGLWRTLIERWTVF